MSLLMHMTKLNMWLVQAPQWLADGEAPAYPLKGLGLQPDSNMSAWEIDEEIRSLDEMATALAACREEFKNFEYVLFDSEVLTEIGINVEERPDDKCCDTGVAPLHRELTEISAQKAACLVTVVFKRLAKDDSLADRILKKEVCRNIRAGISEGRINKDLLHPNILAKIGESDTLSQ